MTAMNDDLLDHLRETLTRSDFLRATASLRGDGGLVLALGTDQLRPLTHEEVAQLERLGNEADDWARVRVTDGFDPCRVRGCRLHGDIALGHFVGRRTVAGGVELPTGVYDSTLVHVVIGHNALVRDVRLLAHYAVGPDALVCDCGEVSCDGVTAFGNEGSLTLGPQTGGRAVPAFAELNGATAAAAARLREPGRGPNLVGPDERDWLAAFAALADLYQQQATSPVGFIGRAAHVRSVPTLRNSFIGPHAVVDGATLVADSTLLSNAAQPPRVESGACLRRGLLQWGSTVQMLAVVDRAVLAEAACVENHAQVRDSFVGPNTSVGEAEILACFLGPFVSCHHAALLVAALWPAGRGNVAYGATVGADQRSRLPDHEGHLGEGIFFGPGASVQYPADFSAAPYTVVAGGLTLPPQRLAFPFALVTAPPSRPPDAGTEAHEVVPAWMLADNPCALERLQARQRVQNRARRSALTFEVLRPETIDLVRDACRRLEAVRERRDIYTEREVAGLGPNFLREANRQKALAAYRFHIELYALLGLKERVQEALGGEPVAPGAARAAADERWEHQRTLLRDEFGVRDAVEALGQLHNMLERQACAIEHSRRRDDRRGAQVQAGYGYLHPSADWDDVVRRTWERARRLQQETEALLAALQEPAVAAAAPPWADIAKYHLKLAN
jgi:hypothetical protein